MAEIVIPSMNLRADAPVKVGDDLVFTGTLYIGGARAHVVARVPFQSAVRSWERAQGFMNAQRFPQLRGLDDVDAEGFVDADEAAGFFDGLLRAVTRSPLGKVVRAVTSVIPGVNMVAGPVFAAAEAVSAARGGRKVPKKLLQVATPEDLKRAKQAHNLIARAKKGDPKALMAFAKLRLQAARPGTPQQRDQLALDAAQLYDGGFRLAEDEEEEVEEEY